MRQGQVPARGGLGKEAVNRPEEVARNSEEIWPGCDLQTSGGPQLALGALRGVRQGDAGTPLNSPLTHRRGKQWQTPASRPILGARRKQLENSFGQCPFWVFSRRLDPRNGALRAGWPGSAEPQAFL